MNLWAPELKQRIAHEKRPSVAALDTEVTEISDGDTLNFDHLKVQVIAVNHLPVRHAFGFIFETSEGRLAIIGDKLTALHSLKRPRVLICLCTKY